MDYLTIGLLLFSILLIIIIIGISKKKNKVNQEFNELKNKRKEELKGYYSEEAQIYQKELELEKESKKHSINSEIISLEHKVANLKIQLNEKEHRYNEVNQDLEVYRKEKIKEIDKAAESEEKRQKLIIDRSIDTYRDLQINKANEVLLKMLTVKELKEKEIEEIQNELEEERSKRAAINEEIRKSEEKEKYNELHSVQLTDGEKEDIHFLLSLEDKLHNKQVLYKLVWSTYLQQAYKNTFHNILGNRDPKNVIYCIENINTGKKYIGKTSAEVSKRWTEHIKTSLNIGSIKTTNIHKALYNHWDEFIFYILAETEKDKLSEMEKYYINFYESDKYGYNIKAGG